MFAVVAVPALGNNPLAVTSQGTAYKWNSFPLYYTVDGGGLGSLSNADANALVAQAFSVWASVPTASVSMTQNPAIGLGPDGDVDDVADFNALFPPGPCPNTSFIIYDSGGTITDGLFGAAASDSILGFTSPCVNSGTGSILAMASVLVVKPFVASPLTTLARSYVLGVFIHELGHGLGLGHSQLNVNCFTNISSCPSNTPGGDVFGVPTMFPILLPLTEAPNISSQATLSVDDISAISTLYPAPNFANSTGTISGTIFFGDDVNHFQGANVIARRVLMADGVTPGDPRVTAVSNVSGMFAQVDHGNPALGRSPSSSGSPDFTQRGVYTIPGLPPGTYTVEVESVNASFTGGSAVGPMASQRGEVFPLSAAAECLKSPESNSDAANPCQNFVLHEGNVLTNNNIILNDSLPTMDVFDAVARNETIATATPLAAGTTTASISANNGPDVDVYAINVPAGQVLSVETFSRRRVPQGYLDSVVELMDANGIRLTNCRIGSNDQTAYNQSCLDDDFFSNLSSSSFTLDSKLAYAGSLGTVYLRVTDALGDFRPDFIYNVAVSFTADTAEVAVPAPLQSFDRQFLSTLPAVKSFTVTSIGAANMVLSASPITITNALPTPNTFALASGSTCVPNLILPPGQSCTVSISFQPATTGVFGGTFNVTSNTSPFPTVAFNLFGICVDFSISPASGSSSKTVGGGQSATFGMSFNPVPTGFALPTDTTFSVSGLPTGAAASFSPASVASGSSTAPSTNTLTVTTTARSTTELPGRLRLPAPPAVRWFFVCVLGLLAVLALTRRQAPGRLRTCALLALVCAFGVLGACGGGNTAGGTQNPNGTPAGTYPLTVTATSGSVTRTTTVTLTVQ